MHPRYKYGEVDNDMALIRLKTKASFNTYVRPACFPDSSVKFPDGEECYITGWGDLSSGGSAPRILQQAKVPLVSQRECTNAMEEALQITCFVPDIPTRKLTHAREIRVVH